MSDLSSLLLLHHAWKEYSVRHPGNRGSLWKVLRTSLLVRTVKTYSNLFFRLVRWSRRKRWRTRTANAISTAFLVMFLVIGNVPTRSSVMDELQCFGKLYSMGRKFIEIFSKLVVRNVEVRLNTISKLLRTNYRQNMINRSLSVVLQYPRETMSPQ